MHSGIDEAVKEKRVWIIQDEDGNFLNRNMGVGGDPIEFCDYKKALQKAKDMSLLYHKDYWVFESVDRVRYKSEIEIENLRQ